MTSWPLCPPPILALLCAFEQATGMPRPAYTHVRMECLRLAHERGIGPEDVKAVARFIKGEQLKPRTAFGPTSLLFKNLMDPDKLEERALLLRAQRQARQRQAPQLRVVGLNESISVLDDEPAVDGQHIAEQLRELRKGMGA